MSVFKEGFRILEDIHKHSIRLYDDAIDFGCLTKEGDAHWNSIRQLVQMYGEKGTRSEFDLGGCSQVIQEVQLMDEWQTGDTFVYKVSYCSLKKCYKYKKMYDGFISIDHIKTIPASPSVRRRMMAQNN